MRREGFFWLVLAGSMLVLLFITVPLLRLVSAPSPAALAETIRDPEVYGALWLSLYTGGCAALICFIFGTPLAYLLARVEFRGKRLIEALVDLPIVIPHPVVGIALLGLVGKNFWLGRLLGEMGVRIVGHPAGIIMVMTFVGLPFYLQAAREGFAAVPPRLEHVSRSLGASMTATFCLVTFPLARRSLLSGVIMAWARALSEFGAVVIIAYHPMIAPVLMFERFQSFGLRYSQPVAVWLILICLLLFVGLRVLGRGVAARGGRG
ncbi:MAG TPA: ABC transporter permease subunit [Proteobacteria bacterium]|nr:ABC transporter permease subunit [Pseudomonadota bacterium]